ncbi:MAG: 4'-phosphopantetheinyl transferase superfamily protein [Clostridia bacterium]|nr:4'-phosphopantetheinyl transferase superfamily protein [Clostridia bacterium]
MNTIRVYYADAAPLKDAELYARYLGLVSETRRKKAESHAHAEGRVLSLAAGLLLKRALTDLGVRYETATVRTGGHGKPYIDGGPFFSLSHSGERALCVAAPFPVGCDAERIRKADLRIADRFFTAEEQAFLSAQEDKQTAFFRLWTLKESYLKLTGAGLQQSLGAFSVFPNGASSRVATPGGTCIRAAEYDPGDGYRLAWCAEGDAAAFTWILVSFDK